MPKKLLMFSVFDENGERIYYKAGNYIIKKIEGEWFQKRFNDHLGNYKICYFKAKTYPYHQFDGIYEDYKETPAIQTFSQKTNKIKGFTYMKNGLKHKINGPALVKSYYSIYYLHGKIFNPWWINEN